MPRWCSTSCRHRASEQRRAAADGSVAREAVERVVTVEAPVVREVKVEVEVVREVKVDPKSGQEWVAALGELVRQLDTGRVYDRDLDVLTGAVQSMVNAVNRRLINRPS